MNYRGRDYSFSLTKGRVGQKEKIFWGKSSSTKIGECFSRLWGGENGQTKQSRQMHVNILSCHIKMATFYDNFQYDVVLPLHLLLLHQNQTSQSYHHHHLCFVCLKEATKEKKIVCDVPKVNNIWIRLKNFHYYLVSTTKTVLFQKAIKKYHHTNKNKKEIKFIGSIEWPHSNKRYFVVVYQRWHKEDFNCGNSHKYVLIDNFLLSNRPKSF